MLNQDYELPGVLTNIIEDYSESYDKSLFGTTDSVLIMGTAFNGVVGTPVPIYNPEHARYLFGGSFNSRTKKEATLVTNIQDAWDRGCRTIYALRISGKEIFKDYQFAVDTNLKLRVSGFFPSNNNKELAMVITNKNSEFYLELFKPANFATFKEKQSGLVESQTSILVNKIELAAGGVEVQNDIVDLIERVNSFPFNNVFKLSIVDESGKDVTYSSEIVGDLRAGDVFSGIYTVGRESNISVQEITEVNLKKVDDDFIKELIINTDVSRDLPVFSKQGNIDEILMAAGVNEYDFLKAYGKLNEIFKKDSIDYEEVSLSNFDAYKKLGSGFAINAEAKEIAPGLGKYKVVEVEDPINKKTAIKDGIYSMIGNHNAKFRVLAGFNADDEIKNRLPRISDFKFVQAGEIPVVTESIKLKTTVKENEIETAKTYAIKFENVLNDEAIAELEGVKDADNFYFEKTATEVTEMNSATFEAFKSKCATDKVYPEAGSLFIVTGESIKLFSVKGKIFKEVLNIASGTLFCSQSNLYEFSSEGVLGAVTSLVKSITASDSSIAQINCIYFVCQNANGTFVVKKINEPTSTKNGVREILTLGTVEQLFKTNEEFFDEGQHVISTTLTSFYGINNEIVIRSSMFDWLSVDDVVSILSKDKDFTKLFTTKINSFDLAQETISDLITTDATELVDREIKINTSIRIPFRTDDNFARQLAQHCMHTSLNTASTHGVIGITKLLDTSLGSVAKKVDELINSGISSDLVVKMENGTNMLNKDNLPYEIGRKISIPVCQYRVRTGDNHTFTSNFAAGYAGMVSTLPLGQSSTNQPVSITAPSYDLTSYQLRKLTRAGFVTTKNSFNKGIVVTDGITMADASSPYKRLSATRVTDACETLIRAACEPFIGKQNNLTNKNALSTAIKSELSKIVGKLINAYDFDILEDYNAAKLGVINIDFTVVPLYEIKEIHANIRVTE